MILKKYEIVIVKLDPTKGSKQKGTRPCVILQNNIANASRINTTIVASLTTNHKKTPSGILISPSKQNSLTEKSRLELTQTKVIDKSRILKKLGKLEPKYHIEISQKLILLFDLHDEF